MSNQILKARDNGVIFDIGATTPSGDYAVASYDETVRDKLAELIQEVSNQAPDGTRIDLDNSLFLPLGSGTQTGTTFTGEWQETNSVGALSFFAFSDQPLTTARLEWSTDGVNPDTDLLGTADYLASEELNSGFYVYYPDPQTYLLKPYYRVVLENTGTDQNLLSAYMWKFPPGAQPFTFVDPNATLSTLSKSVLVRSIDPASVVSHFTDKDNGVIPSGAAITVDPVLNEEPNVLDSGWIDTSIFSGKSIINAITDQPVKVYLMNASSDQGDNIFGNQSPTLVTNSTFPTQLSALYADDYFRMVVCNDSGSSLADYSIRAVAAPESTEGVSLSIDSQIFGFFPAQVVRSVIAGKQPDGNYSNLRTDGQALLFEGDLDADEVYTFDEFKTDGYRLIQLTITATEPSATDGIKIEYLSDINAGNPKVIDRALATFSEEDTQQGYMTASFETRGDGFRLVYTNGAVPVVGARIGVELRTAPIPAARSNRALITDTTQVTLTKGGIHAPDENGNWDNIQRSGSSLKTSVDSVESPVKIAPLSNWGARSSIVNSTTATLLPTPLVSGDVAGKLVQNEGTGNVYISDDPDSVFLATERFTLFPQSSIELDVDATVWVLAESTGGATSTAALPPSSATGATNPSNALLSDDSYAFLDSGDTLTMGSFSGQEVLPIVSRLEVGIEGRIAESSPSTETIQYQSEYDVTGGNVGSLESPVVTANQGSLYIASVTTRQDVDVNSVSGMGLTWTLAGTSIIDDSGVNRVSVWIGSGTPTSGTVTSIFSTAAQNCTMKVTEWTGVDLNSPIENYETLGVAGGSTSYSDSIIGTKEGMAITFVTSTRRNHSPGAGFIELNEIGTGTGPQDNRQSVSYKHIGATGIVPYSGTFNASANWVLAALTLRPRPVEDPVVNVQVYRNGVPVGAPHEVVITSLGDQNYMIDILDDYPWEPSDVSLISFDINYSANGSADVEVDYAYLVEEEAEDGATQRVGVVVVS